VAGFLLPDANGDLTVGGNINFSTPRTGYSQIQPVEFVGSGSGASSPFAVGIDWINGVYKLMGGANVVYAPFKLPQNAVLTRFGCYFDETSAAADSAVTLCRGAWDGVGSGQEVITTITTSGSSATTNTEFVGALNNLRTTIDLEQYSYYLYGTFGNVDGPNVQIKRCKATYTIDGL